MMRKGAFTSINVINKTSRESSFVNIKPLLIFYNVHYQAGTLYCLYYRLCRFSLLSVRAIEYCANQVKQFFTLFQFIFFPQFGVV